MRNLFATLLLNNFSRSRDNHLQTPYSPHYFIYEQTPIRYTSAQKYSLRARRQPRQNTTTMASSPEARPADAAEAAPVAEKVEVATEAADAPVEKDNTEAKAQADGPAVEATAADDSEGKGDEEAKEENGTEKADEPSIPTDSTAAADTTTVVPISPPPLPDEPLPDEAQADENDDGWDPMWSEEHQAWYFVNRFTQQTQWENPRVPDQQAAAGGAAAAVTGYNPAIHGDYDPNAWYAKGEAAPSAGTTDTTAAAGIDAGAPVTGSDPISAAAAAAAAIIQDSTANRYSHDAKASRQLNSYFDVAATNGSHDGRSLKAERSGIKPSKSELKAFKEKRRARKEEKRRAWLRD